MKAFDELRRQVQTKQNTISDFLFIRRMSIRLTYLLTKTPVTPNQVTVLSFAVYIAACIIFVDGTYPLIIWGAVLMVLGITLDCADGELARAKDMVSEGGGWLDAVLDKLAQVLAVSSIVIGQSDVLRESNSLIIGYIAVINIVILGALNLYKFKNKDVNKPAVSVGRNLRFGFSEIIVLIAVCSMVDRLAVALWFMATVLAAVWVKSLIGILRK